MPQPVQVPLDARVHFRKDGLSHEDQVNFHALGVSSGVFLKMFLCPNRGQGRTYR
jgi:hypothetical protein